MSRDGGSLLSVSGLDLLHAGSHRVHDKEMKSGGAYCDGRCFTGPRIFPLRVRTATKISQEFPGNEGAEFTGWRQEPLLAIFLVAVTAFLVARCEVSNCIVGKLRPIGSPDKECQVSSHSSL